MRFVRSLKFSSCRPPFSPSGCSDAKRRNANMAKAKLKDLPTLPADLLYCALALMLLMCIAFCSYFYWYVKRELRDFIENRQRRPEIRRSTPEERADELVNGLTMRQRRLVSEERPIACNGQASRSENSPAQASRSMQAVAPRHVRQQTSQAGPAQMARRRQSEDDEHADAMRMRVRAAR